MSTTTTTTSTTTTTLLLTEGMAGHWTMDTAHIYGTTLDDQSGNDNDGALSGDPQPGTREHAVNIILS